MRAAPEPLAETPEERFERLKEFAADLQSKCDSAEMREKIAALLEGVRVDH